MINILIPIILAKLMIVSKIGIKILKNILIKFLFNLYATYSKNYPKELKLF